MITRGSVRRKSAETFKQVIILRKQGHSYTEIIKATGVAKSTISNWIAFAGLNLSQEHMQIQTRKRLENHTLGTEASKRTRSRQKEADINNFIMKYKKRFNDPFFNYALALFEAEGCKSTTCRFSNSDFRLVVVFMGFIEHFFNLDRQENMSFRLYIHETRKRDLEKIINFWSKKMAVSKNKIKVSWKHNQVVKRRENPDYVGQMNLVIQGQKVLGSKLLAISDIILRKYQN